MPLNETDRLFLRNSLPFWEALSEEQKSRLVTASASRHYPAGTLLHSIGDCAGLFLLKTGEARTYILSEEGREVTLFRLFPPEFCLFSASCMLKNIRFDVTIEAVKDTDTILIPTYVYRELNQSCVKVAEFTNQLLSARLSEVMWLMEQILFMSFDRRLAMYLLKRAGESGDGRIPATHEQIAKDLGSAREVVTRMLRYFQDEGAVRLSRGAVIVADRERLESWSK